MDAGVSDHLFSEPMIVRRGASVGDGSNARVVTARRPQTGAGGAVAGRRQRRQRSRGG